MSEVSRRWPQENLTALQEKDKLRQVSGPSTKYQLEAKVGDIVQIVDEDKEQLGKIIKLLTSHDGQIRSAQILYKNRISIQPLNNLRHIESAFDKNAFLTDEEKELVTKHALKVSGVKDKSEKEEISNMVSPCPGKTNRASARLEQKK